MVQDQDLKIANSQLRLAIAAIREVIGPRNTQELLQSHDSDYQRSGLPPEDMQLEVPAEYFAGLLAAIEDTYSSQGPEMSERIGRAAFQQVLRGHPAWLRPARATMKLWKPNQRVEVMLEALIETQRKTYQHYEAWIENKNGQIAYIEQNCPDCYKRQSSSPVCFYKAGFISESIHWATDLDFNCHETACLAAGDPYCCFSISKTSASQ
jgi:predicted hydrocarbon binding protein